jgi:hypothetical protein
VLLLMHLPALLTCSHCRQKQERNAGNMVFWEGRVQELKVQFQLRICCCLLAAELLPGHASYHHRLLADQASMVCSCRAHRERDERRVAMPATVCAAGLSCCSSR